MLYNAYFDVLNYTRVDLAGCLAAHAGHQPSGQNLPAGRQEGLSQDRGNSYFMCLF